MATSSAEFLINIEQRLKGDDAVSELEKSEQALKDSIAGYKQLETSQARISKQLERVQSAMAGTRGATEALSRKEAELKSALDSTNASLEKQKSAASHAAEGLEAARKAQAKVGVGAQFAQTEVFNLETAFKDLGGPIGSTIGTAFEMGEALQKLFAAAGPAGLLVAGIVAVGGAAVVTTAAVVALGAAGAKMGLELANAARDQKLTLEAMLGSQDAADQMSGTFRDVQDATGATNQRMLELTRAMQKSGGQGEELGVALKAIAMQEQALGTTEGTADLIKSLEEGKVSAAELAAEMEKKYGAVLQKKMLGLDQSIGRLKNNLARLFSSLDIEGFLTGFSKFVGMFKETEPLGAAIRDTFNGIFQPLFDGASRALPFIVSGIRKVGQVASGLAKQFAPAVAQLRASWDQLANNQDVQTALKAAGMIIVSSIIPAITFATAAIKGLAAGFSVFASGAAPAVGFVISAVGMLTSAAAKVKDAWTAVSGAVSSAIDSLKAKGQELYAIGANFVQGLINGIKSKLPDVGGAISSVGNKVMELKDTLKLGSPSRLAMYYGEMFTEGFTIGVDSGNDNLERAVSGMLSGGGEKPQQAKGAISVNFAPVININAPSGEAEDIRAVAKDAVRELWQEISDELGVGATEAA